MIVRVPLLILLVAASGLAACGKRYPMQAQLPYKAELVGRNSGRDFAVKVFAPSVALEDLRSSVSYPATVHCLENYGSSDVAWVIDPATNDWAMQRTEKGETLLRGHCTAR